MTKAVQCGQHSFRLIVQVGEREMVFAFENPKDSVVRNVKELQSVCGSLRPQQVTVLYKAGPVQR